MGRQRRRTSAKGVDTTTDSVDDNLSWAIWSNTHTKNRTSVHSASRWCVLKHAFCCRCCFQRWGSIPGDGLTLPICPHCGPNVDVRWLQDSTTYESAIKVKDSTNASCWVAHIALVRRTVVVVRQSLASLVEKLCLDQSRNGDGGAAVGG